MRHRGFLNVHVTSRKHKYAHECYFSKNQLGDVDFKMGFKWKFLSKLQEELYLQ